MVTTRTRRRSNADKRASINNRRSSRKETTRQAEIKQVQYSKPAINEDIKAKRTSNTPSYLDLARGYSSASYNDLNPIASSVSSQERRQEQTDRKATKSREPINTKFFSWEGQANRFKRVGKVLNPFDNDRVMLGQSNIDVTAPTKVASVVGAVGSGAYLGALGLSALGVGGATAGAGATATTGATATGGAFGLKSLGLLGGGALLGSFLSGGSDPSTAPQDQQQTINQTPQQITNPTQPNNSWQDQRIWNYDYSQNPNIIQDSPYAGISAERYQELSPSQAFTPSQNTNPSQSASATPSQSAQQTASANTNPSWLIPALIGGAVIYLANKR